MVDMLFIALLASLFVKNAWSSPIICLFLFMAKVVYVFVWRHQYSDNHWIIKNFSLFLLYLFALAKLKSTKLKKNQYGLHTVEYKFVNHTAVPTYAFYGCSNLQNFDFHPSCNEIGSYAFYGCSGLTNLQLPANITAINDYCFYYCSGIQGELVIPEGGKTIGTNAFADIDNVISVTLPSSLTLIGDKAFYWCNKLEKIVTKSSTAPTISKETFYNNYGGVLVVPDGRTSAYSGWMQTTSYYLGYNSWVCVEEDDPLVDGIYYSQDMKKILKATTEVLVRLSSLTE